MSIAIDPVADLEQPVTAHKRSVPSLPVKAARYQSLDMGRGLACMMLVVFHATMQVARLGPPSAGGLWNDTGVFLINVIARMWIGVPIFFVISGYCITATIDSRRRKSGGIVEYFKRRFWRIYPPYWIALVVSMLVILLAEYRALPGLFSDGIFTVPPPGDLSAWQWFGNFTLTESWRHLIVGDGPLHLLPNTWTLCYEEQFYFVAGMLVLLAPKRFFRATCIFTIFVVAVKIATHAAGMQLEGLFVDGRWLLIAAGVMVYYRINYATRLEGRLIHALLLLGMLLADRNPGMLLEFEPNHGIERFVAYGFALAISLAYPWDAAISRSRLLRPLAWCGGFSYSIYLAHPLVTKGICYGLFRAGMRGHWETLLIILPLCVVASLIVARVFYWLVERRFLNTPPGGAARSLPRERTLAKVSTPSLVEVTAG